MAALARAPVLPLESAPRRSSGKRNMLRKPEVVMTETAAMRGLENWRIQRGELPVRRP
jgi:hypothetical protein